jgi:hypothetical protein
MLDFGVRAEILLARGDVEAGLHLWRRAADRLRNTPAVDGELPGSAAWAWEAQAVTVIAHAHHGRLDLVEEITGELPDALSRRLTNPTAGPAAPFG